MCATVSYETITHIGFGFHFLIYFEVLKFRDSESIVFNTVSHNFLSLLIIIITLSNVHKVVSLFL